MRDYSDLALVDGGGNSDLTRKVARILHVDLTPIEIGRHADGEPSIGDVGDLRKKVVVDLASLQQPDRNFINVAIQADIARRAAPLGIHGIFTYMAYARQDRRDKPRTAITVKIVARMLATRFDSAYLFDVHSDVPAALFEAYSDAIVVDPLISRVVRLDWLDKCDLSRATILSMDLGTAKPARSICRRLYDAGHRTTFCLADKNGTSSQGLGEILLASDGDIEGTDVYGFDDMSSTAGTAVDVSRAVKARNPRSISVFLTHGVLANEEACHNLMDAPIDRIVVTDSVPLPERYVEILRPKLEVVTLAPFFAIAVDCIYRQRSISSRLFDLAGYRSALAELQATT